MPFGLGVVDIFANLLLADVFVEVFLFVEHRLTQLVVIERSARTSCCVLTLAITTHDPTHPLGGNILGVIHHFHKYKFAVALVLFIQAQHRMGRSSRTGKGVEDDIIGTA